MTYIETPLQQSTVTEVSGQRIRPPIQGSWVRIWIPQKNYFAPLRRPRHLSKAPNAAIQRFLGGRVVDFATLPMMVSRLGWGS